MDQIGGDDDAKVNSNSMEVEAMIQNIKNNTPGMGADAPPDYDIFGKKKYAYRFIRKKQEADISPALHTEVVRIMPDIKEIRKYLFFLEFSQNIKSQSIGSIASNYFFSILIKINLIVSKNSIEVKNKCMKIFPF